MATIVTRAGKGSPLTNAEVDANFVNLNNDKLEVDTAASTYAPLGGAGASGTWSISITGNASTVTDGLYSTGSYANPTWITSLAGSKITGDIAGNAGTVTNGVYTSVSYANPAWITSLAETKVLPTQTGNSGKFLTTNGTSTSWGTVDLTPYLTTATAASTYAPLGGAGTSGTWGISITGNAATVTGGVYTTGTQTIGGAKEFSTDVRVAGAVFRTQASGTGYFVYGTNGTTNNGLYYDQTNSEVSIWTVSSKRFYIDSSGNATCTGNITANSDERLKENIQLIPDALAKVEAVRGVTYTRKDTGEAGIGVIAQDIRKVAPEAIVIGSDGMMSVAYGNLVGLLIEAVKDLSGQVKELKAKVGS